MMADSILGEPAALQLVMRDNKKSTGERKETVKKIHNACVGFDRKGKGKLTVLPRQCNRACK